MNEQVFDADRVTTDRAKNASCVSRGNAAWLADQNMALHQVVGPAWAYGRAQLRRRWTSAVVIALLVGTAGGVVLTAYAGARRTDTAYPGT